jgi:C4-dicarboxylate transporter DctM subunit
MRSSPSLWRLEGSTKQFRFIVERGNLLLSVEVGYFVMEPMAGVSVLIIVVLVLLGTGMPIGFALAAGGTFALCVVLPYPQLSVLGSIPWSSTWSFVLTALPLFIFMGEIMLKSGISDSAYEEVVFWLRGTPGGLAYANIVSCALFSAASGSSVATAGTIGTVAIPAMKKFGYEKRLFLGSLAAGGTLGILIPPSIPLIIYGGMVGESVGRLFMGGVVPGILMATVFCMVILVRAILNPGIAPKGSGSSTSHSYISSFLKMSPLISLVLVVLGGIYGGVMTPTEAASTGAVASLVLCGMKGRLRWVVVRDSLCGAVVTTSMILFIMVGASILNYSINWLGLPGQLVEKITQMGVSPYVVLIIITLLYFVLGCFLDPISVMIMTLPTVYPLIRAVGFDSVWFGIYLVINIELGCLTPPVGMNLFVIRGIDRENSLRDITLGAVPFMIGIVIMMAVITLFPALVLFLPDKMF